MARGISGRIVLEVDPGLKRQLYSVLVRDGLTMKDWFLAEARRFLSAHPGRDGSEAKRGHSIAPSIRREGPQR